MVDVTDLYYYRSYQHVYDNFNVSHRFSELFLVILGSMALDVHDYNLGAE